MTQARQQAEVLKVRDLASTVRELILSPIEWKVAFKPGQWISLQLPIGKRPPLVRAYSMAKPEMSSGHLVLVFDRVPEGLGSGYLYTLKEGDRVVMSGPHGKFVVPEPLAGELLLIGRYTGIVPLRCIIKDLVSREKPLSITLVYSAPSQEDLIYHDEFIELDRHHDTFRYMHLLLGRDGHTREEQWPEIEMISSLFEGRRDFLPMICGIRAFVNPLREHFRKLGFERRQIRHEIYD